MYKYKPAMLRSIGDVMIDKNGKLVSIVESSSACLGCFYHESPSCYPVRDDGSGIGCSPVRDDGSGIGCSDGNFIFVNHPEVETLVPYSNEILHYMARAKNKWPEYPVDPVHATAIMVEEAGEALREANRVLWENGKPEDLRTELFHTIVTALRCLEVIDKDQRN